MTSANPWVLDLPAGCMHSWLLLLGTGPALQFSGLQAPALAALNLGLGLWLPMPAQPASSCHSVLCP